MGREKYIKGIELLLQEQRRMDSLEKEIGIRKTEWRILQLLHQIEDKNKTASYISSCLKVEYVYTTRIINGLIKGGYILQVGVGNKRKLKISKEGERKRQEFVRKVLLL